MKNKIIPFVAIIILLFTNLGFADKPPQQEHEQEKYQYMQIISWGNRIHISTSSEFLTRDMRAYKQEDYDFTYIMKLIEEYQIEGWEVINNSISYKPHSNDLVNSILLRK